MKEKVLGTEIRVPFFDTDAMGIVHHANYLRYFEVARVTWLSANGLNYKELQAQGINLPLVASACRYRRPARFDDRLQVYLRGELTGMRLILNYEILCEGQLLTTGSTEHVAVDASMKMVDLPPALKQIIISHS